MAACGDAATAPPRSAGRKVFHHPRTGSGCELLLACAASQQGESRWQPVPSPLPVHLSLCHTQLMELEELHCSQGSCRGQGNFPAQPDRPAWLQPGVILHTQPRVNADVVLPQASKMSGPTAAWVCPPAAPQQQLEFTSPPYST